ncbi:unnamed protein product, partial [Pocillopora meandrina]
ERITIEGISWLCVFVSYRDFTWDVNDYLLGLRDDVKSWKEVYWRLWGAVNVLYCHRCGNIFQCSELGHCSYHPMTVDFGNLDCTATKIVGIYPYCQQRVLHFDPSLEGTFRTQQNKENSAESSDNKKDDDVKAENSEGNAEKDKDEEKSSQPEKGKSTEEEQNTELFCVRGKPRNGQLDSGLTRHKRKATTNKNQKK